MNRRHFRFDKRLLFLTDHNSHMIWFFILQIIKTSWFLFLEKCLLWLKNSN